jgi:hypothetical protein
MRRASWQASVVIAIAALTSSCGDSEGGSAALVDSPPTSVVDPAEDGGPLDTVTSSDPQPSVPATDASTTQPSLPAGPTASLDEVEIGSGSVQPAIESPKPSPTLTMPQSDTSTTTAPLEHPPVSSVSRRRQLLLDPFPGGPLFPLIAAAEQGEDWNGELTGALIDEGGAVLLCTAVNEELPPSCAAGVEIVGSEGDLATLVIAQPPRFSTLKGVFLHNHLAFAPEF